MTDALLSNGLINVQVFKANGTYTPTAGMVNCLIQAVGGGGAGGGNTSASLTTCPGGGAGGFSQSYVSSATIGASQTVTIGAGGTGTSTAGNNGSDTSIGTLVIAKGGSGGAQGASASTAGGAGGVVGTGDVSLPGGPGMGSIPASGASLCGAGGNSFFGGGALALAVNTGTAGHSAVANSGGGGGGAASSSSSAKSGGDGGSGLVVIYEYDASNSIVLPTTTDHIATYADTAGTLSEDPTTASTNGALYAGTTITAETNLFSNTGFIQALEGDVLAGSNGFGGTLNAFAPTLNNGSLLIKCANAGASYLTTITTTVMGQSTVLTIPDPGADSDFILTNSGSTQTIASGNLSITNGSLSVPGGTVQGGNVQAGSNGVTGELISYPSTTNNGWLVIQATNAGGPYITTINTGTMGQSTAYTIPDIGSPTGGIVVATSNLRMKSVSAASAAGGSASQSFTDAFCTSSSIVSGSWTTQTNAASVLTIVPSNGSFVVLSTADAGSGTFSYTITK